MFDNGGHVGFLCPTWQTPEETAETKVNTALTDVTSLNQDHVGRWRVRNPMSD